MATKIFLPRLGESIIEATVSRWLKKPGDEVKRGDILAELETAKATMELETPVKGTLLTVCQKPGDVVHLNELMAVVGMPGEKWENEVDNSPTDLGKVQTSEQVINKPKIESEGRMRISPNARRQMREMGISIDALKQIKKPGRIVAGDLTVLKKTTSQSTYSSVPFLRLPLNNIQLVTAQRMSQSTASIPQFSVSMDCEADALIAYAETSKKPGEKITITAVLLWLTAVALLKHPRLNARFDENAVLQFSEINIGVAVATPFGLLVPVIHQINKLTIEEIASDLNQKAAKANQRILNIAEMEGGTFTVSNLGMKGIRSFSPIVDPGQAAILGVGAIRKGLYKNDQGEIVEKSEINLTITADHRVVGGSEVADFLLTLKKSIENLNSGA